MIPRLCIQCVCFSWFFGFIAIRESFLSIRGVWNRPRDEVGRVPGHTTSIQWFHSWFGRYVRPFWRDRKAEEVYAISLKIIHSQRVRREIVTIGKGIGLGANDLFLAELIGLFHDIGRFEQFHLFHTFVDNSSVDHALLGRQVIEREGLLGDLPDRDASIVLDAIYYHNKLAIPSHFKGLRLLMSRLIRDADKLDILRVFHSLYEKGGGCATVNLDLPDSPAISRDVREDFLAGRVVDFKNVRSTTDFLVMRLSWLYDIYFPLTFKMIRDRGYIASMEDQLSQVCGKEEICNKVRQILSDEDR